VAQQQQPVTSHHTAKAAARYRIIGEALINLPVKRSLAQAKRPCGPSKLEAVSLGS